MAGWRVCDEIGDREMIYYLDKTFCAMECKEKNCGRKLNEKVIRSAELEGIPVAYAYFKDCQKWKPTLGLKQVM